MKFSCSEELKNKVMIWLDKIIKCNGLILFLLKAAHVYLFFISDTDTERWWTNFSTSIW